MPFLSHENWIGSGRAICSTSSPRNPTVGNCHRTNREQAVCIQILRGGRGFLVPPILDTAFFPAFQIRTGERYAIPYIDPHSVSFRVPLPGLQLCFELLAAVPGLRL